MKLCYGLQTFSKFKNFYLTSRPLCSRIPSQPIGTTNKEEVVQVDKNTISLLERLSLVKTDPEEGSQILEDSIKFANKILHINTENVQPLYSVLEDRNLNLRTDNITQGYCQKDILKNASLKEDDYFVAPLGNIPLHEVDIDDNLNSQKTKNEI